MQGPVTPRGSGRLEPELLRIGKAFGKLVATQYPTGMAEGTA